MMPIFSLRVLFPEILCYLREKSETDVGGLEA
jgi:hypothetical protein